jgi:glucose-6-phosphate dehydrogenase assembly protein OpcA
VVLDSAAMGNAAEILARLDGLTRSGRILADLAWTRLTRWRQMVAQIFENRSYLALLAGVQQVRIGFGGSAPPTGAYYLGAWLLDCLEGAGAKASVQWNPAEKAGEGELVRVELNAPQGDGLQVSIAVSGDPERRCAEVRVNKLASRTVFAPDNDYTLLRQELSIPGRDPVFEKTLARAARLARAE